MTAFKSSEVFLSTDSRRLQPTKGLRLESNIVIKMPLRRNLKHLTGFGILGCYIVSLFLYHKLHVYVRRRRDRRNQQKSEPENGEEHSPR